MNKILKNMKIRTKLMAAFIFVAVILFAVSAIAVVDIYDTIDKGTKIYDKVLVSIDYLTQSTSDLERMKVDGRNAILNISDPQKLESTIANMNACINRITSSTQAYAETIVRDEAWVTYDDFTTAFNEYVDLMKDYYDLLRAGKSTEALAFMEEYLSPRSQACLDDLKNFSTIKLDLGHDLTSKAISSAEFAFVWLLIIAIFGILVTAIFGVYFAISISKPIIQGAELMMKAGDGDFTIRLPSEDYGAEIGEFFKACNAMNAYTDMSAGNIAKVSRQIKDSAQNMLSISSHMAINSKGLNEQTSSVSTAAEEFSAGMTQSSNSLSTATSHINAVASSIEEINSTISTVAAAAEQTSVRVQQSSELVDSIKNTIVTTSASINLVSNTFNSLAESVNDINKSISVVSDHSVVAMNRMAEADGKAKNTNAIIQRLEAASKQIGKIVSVISDIADQTNMLALNAAIEAAGAGEAGKGFMVVANEVKELAKQTADATDEIADQIENMQKNMPEAVGAVSEITAIINGMTEFMESFAAEIKQQGKRSDQIADESAAAAKRMTEITTEVNKINENAQSVTKTVIESTKGVNEIAKSTAELVIGTQEIAMNSERASNNISEIDRVAKEMVLGLVDISKNIQFINEEAGQIQLSADSTKVSSEELLVTASDMEKFVSKFKIS